MRYSNCMKVVVLASLMLVFKPVLALDVKGYSKLAKEIVKEALSGSVSDVDALIAKQEELIKMGVAGCNDHASANPKDAKLLNLVTANADKMKAMSLEEIEDQWHDGGYLTSNGVDVESYDHFGAAYSLMDTVVHPATGIIALKMYKTSKDPELLTQVKEELSEVLEHIKHVGS